MNAFELRALLARRIWGYRDLRRRPGLRAAVCHSLHRLSFLAALPSARGWIWIWACIPNEAVVDRVF